MSLFLLGTFELFFALQAGQATVAGTVRDAATAAPLPGATVALTELQRSVTTDANGRYLLRGVPAGPQHVTVHVIGYAQRTLDALVPGDGELEINVSLRYQPITLKPLNVRTNVAMRGVEIGDSTTFPDRSISIAAVRNHPLLSEPDVLMALSGGEVVLKPESPNGMHIRGGASDQTAYLLDGVPVISPYHAAGMFSAWNPDAIGRLDLSSSAPSPILPAALSGTVSAVTRSPGTRLSALGSISNTQARVTADGPLGGAGAGFMLSARMGMRGGIAPRNDAGYLGIESGDLLATLAVPMLGGQLRVLGYDSDNEIVAAATADPQSTRVARNIYSWHSQSLGGTWSRAMKRGRLVLTGWTASGDANVHWAPDVAPTLNILAERRDHGILAYAERTRAASASIAGFRIERIRTEYQRSAESSDIHDWGDAGGTSVATAFAQHSARLGARTGVELGLSLAAAGSRVHPGPRATVTWAPRDALKITGSYARLHQYAQSLRNPESVVSNIFPVDLYIAADGERVPVARSDQVVFAAEYAPGTGFRAGMQAFRRLSRGLLLVAPHSNDPFANGVFSNGTGTAHGVTVDASVSGARFGALASYGWQRVLLDYGNASYVPDFGSRHHIEAGAIVFPTATSSVRAGVTVITGRSTTSTISRFEWESCNLLDRGCEFSGSPTYGVGTLGATSLPAYVRADVGVRKHWHIEAGSRDAVIALFGTFTNVIARRNILTFVLDPSTGQRSAVEMRPRSPLVVGLDWSF